MSLIEIVQTLQGNPAALESLYHETCQSGEEKRFEEAVERLYQQQADNPLLAAWHYRLTFNTERGAVTPSANWMLAGVVGLATGFVFAALADEGFTLLAEVPALAFLWAPIAALFVLGYLSFAGPIKRRSVLISAGALVLITLYVLLVGQLDFRFHEQYIDLMLVHVPFLSWAAIGLAVTYLPSRVSRVQVSRFAFVRKSLEVIVTGGLYLVAGILFAGITVGMFEALGVELPDALMSRLGAGGAGLLPIIAVGSAYDARRLPDEQDFGLGVGRLVPIITQLLLPLALVVLVLYIATIPFNFYAPFRDRDVLIIYNVMLFAVVGLLVGITPMNREDIAPALRPWIRRGVVALAVLAVLVGLYALAAVVTRTVEGGWTANRIAVIGWNVVNIGLLTAVAVTQVRLRNRDWTQALKHMFGKGALVYVAWTLGLLLLLPLVLALL